MVLKEHTQTNKYRFVKNSPGPEWCPGAMTQGTKNKNNPFGIDNAASYPTVWDSDQ